MSDILERAHETQRKVADQSHVTLKLSFLQDLIAEIERLRAMNAPASIRSIANKLEGSK